MSTSCDRRGWRVFAASAAVTVTVPLALMSSAAASAAPIAACAPYVIVGVPGSNEGKRFNPASAQPEDLYGPEVWQAVQEVSVRLQQNGLPTAVSTPADYPAILDENPLKTALLYGISQYQKSKDAGYANTYALVGTVMETCDSSQLILIGYSQGAHVAGDVAQTILHSGTPIDAERLGGVLLLADPAFNNDSPGTWTFDYSGTASPFVGITNYQRAEDANGSLGSRAAFDENDPVVSICINGDAVCAATAENLDSERATTIHTSYKSAEFSETGKSTATWSADLLVDTMLAG